MAKKKSARLAKTNAEARSKREPKFNRRSPRLRRQAIQETSQRHADVRSEAKVPKDPFAFSEEDDEEDPTMRYDRGHGTHGRERIGRRRARNHSSSDDEYSDEDSSVSSVTSFDSHAQSVGNESTSSFSALSPTSTSIADLLAKRRVRRSETPKGKKSPTSSASSSGSASSRALTGDRRNRDLASKKISFSSPSRGKTSPTKAKQTRDRPRRHYERSESNPRREGEIKSLFTKEQQRELRAMNKAMAEIDNHELICEGV